MVKLEHYSNLTSKHEDLLENKYCLKHPLVIKLKPRCINDFFLGAKSSLKSGELPAMSTNIKYSGVKDLKFNTKIDSKGKLSLKAETTSERFKNAKITSELGLLKNQVSSASITFDFCIPDKLKSRIKLFDGPAVEVQSTLAILDISGVSFSSTLNLSSHTIDQINLGLWYKKNKTDIVLKHESKSLSLQNLSLALYHQIKHLKLGGQLLINLQKDQEGLSGEAGFQYRLKEKLNARAKINLEGVLSAGIDSVMGENCKISLTTQHSLLQYKLLGPWEWGIVVELAA